MEKRNYRFAYTLIGCACFILLNSLTTFAADLIFTTQDFRPFSYNENKKVAGPAVEIIGAVCKSASINCSFELYPWSRAQLKVKEGKANGMFVIGWNKKRADWLHFTPPLLNTEYGFFVHTDNQLLFKNVANIKGYKVGVYGPSNTSRSLEKIKVEIKDLKIDMTTHDESPFKKLEIKRVDAVYSNKDVGNALIKKLKLKNIRYAGAQKRLKYFIGFSKQYTDKKLADQFNASFKKLHKSGVIPNILKKYSMDPAKIK